MLERPNMLDMLEPLQSSRSGGETQERDGD